MILDGLNACTRHRKAVGAGVLCVSVREVSQDKEINVVFDRIEIIYGHNERYTVA
jgi:hypothetical protein